MHTIKGEITYRRIGKLKTYIHVMEFETIMSMDRVGAQVDNASEQVCVLE